MPKNMTLSIPDDVYADMESMPEVNWSAVAKASIKTYIDVRKKPDIAPLLEELLRQKSEEYVNGRKKADDIAKKSGYRMIDIVLRKYCAITDDAEDKANSGCPPWDIPDIYLEFGKALIKLNVIDSEASGEYLKGIQERLEEINKVLRQQK